MRTKRKLIVLPVLVLTGLAAAACSSSGSSSSPAASASATSSVNLSSVTLNVGDQKGTGAEALLKAAGLLEANGTLKGYPFKLAWTDFTSGPPILEAESAGAVDVGGVGDVPPVFAASGGEGVVIVGARQVPNGDQDAIVVPKGSSITSVSQLKGKKIAYGSGSSANYQLLTVLNRESLTTKDVDLVNLQPADALAAFTSGSVDAWDIWPPYVQEVQSMGGKVIAVGSAYGSPYDFEVASKSAVANPEKAAAIQDYLTVLDKAYVWAEAHPSVWGATWATAAGLSSSITDAAAKVDGTTPIVLNSTVTSALQAMVTNLFKAGLIPNDVNISGYVTSQFNSSVGGS